MTDGPQISLKRRQIDSQLAPHIPIRQAPQFENGFIREFREAIGMSRMQLAKRLSMTPQGLTKLELSEQTGTISLNTLNKVAAELDCKLVYALVPNKSLGKLVENNALRAAAAILQQDKDSAATVRLAKQMVARAAEEIWDI